MDSEREILDMCDKHEVRFFAGNGCDICRLEKKGYDAGYAAGRLAQGAIRAQDEREAKAGELCGVSRELFGCDWPDAVAEEVLVLRKKLAEAEAALREQKEGK